MKRVHKFWNRHAKKRNSREIARARSQLWKMLGKHGRIAREVHYELYATPEQRLNEFITAQMLNRSLEDALFPQLKYEVGIDFGWGKDETVMTVFDGKTRKIIRTT